MRILTVGSKLSLVLALAERPELDVTAISPLDPSLVPASSRLAMIPYPGGSKLSFSAISHVRAAIKQIRPDVIHAFYPRPLAHAVFASASLGTRIPIVSYRGISSPPNRWSPSEWITYLSPYVAAHACESAAVRDALVSAGVEASRCHVVHNCLSKPLSSISRDEARGRLHLAPDDWVVMMVANMRPVKGADILLEAALECRDLPRLRMVLVGEVKDPRIARLAADPRLAPLVQLVGYRRDAAELVAAADVFVMPSRAEALSVALLEAMARGICPAVSDAGGMKEAVRHGLEGLVFPKEDPVALAATLRHLAANPDLATHYADQARRRAAEDFSPTAIAQRVAAIYQHLAAAA